MEIFQITHKDEIKDQQIALVASFLSITLLLVASYFITFFIYAPVPKDIPPFKSDEVIQEFMIDNVTVQQDGGSSGGGTASNDKLDTPKEQVQQVLTGNNNINVKVNSGNSNKTNGNNTQNGPSTSHRGNNPFGSGGNGGGNGSGNGPFGGPGNGNGDGDGIGNGRGSGKGRIRLNNVSLPRYESDFDCRIGFKVQVNAEGQVIGVRTIKSVTTCIDDRTINDIKERIKREVKYNKEPGASTVDMDYTINLKASNS